MKHITYADKSLLLGDDAADTLLEYAAALARHGSSDEVTVRAVSSDGDEVMAKFLLGAGAPLMAETAHSSLPEPNNANTVIDLRAQLDRLEHPQPVVAEDLPEKPLSLGHDFD